MAGWEQALLGVGALIILFLFWPGARKAVTDSPKATREDWMSLLKPMAAVVLFVIVLIMMVKS